MSETNNTKDKAFLRGTFIGERNALGAIDKAIEEINKLHPHPILTNLELALESCKERLYEYINAQG